MNVQTQSDRNPIDQDTWLNEVFLHTHTFTCPLIEELTVALFTTTSTERSQKNRTAKCYHITKSISQFCLLHTCHNPSTDVQGATNTLKQAHCKPQNIMLKPRFSRVSTFYNLLLSLPLVSYLYLLIFFLNDLWFNIHLFHLVPLGSWSSNTSHLTSSYYVKVLSLVSN